MGIYTSGSIFGIRICNFNDDAVFANILFEAKYDKIIHNISKCVGINAIKGDVAIN